MAQLTAGFYYTRNWRIVQLLTSSVIGSVTVWAANIFGEPAAVPPSPPVEVEAAIQYQETGQALPQSTTPPVGPLATIYQPGIAVNQTVGGPQMTDLMWAIGTVGGVAGGNKG
jgi:hypothetical protein